MKQKRRAIDLFVFASLSPLLVIGWITGLAYSALETGFWYARQYIDNASK